VLLLRRKVGERITIGRDVEVTVLEVGPHGVTLGVQEPQEVAVRRRGRREPREAQEPEAGGGEPAAV
jgi:carbon storage regulator